MHYKRLCSLSLILLWLWFVHYKFYFTKRKGIIKIYRHNSWKHCNFCIACVFGRNFYEIFCILQLRFLSFLISSIIVKYFTQKNVFILVTTIKGFVEVIFPKMSNVTNSMTSSWSSQIMESELKDLHYHGESIIMERIVY